MVERTKAPDVQDVTAKPAKADYSALEALEKQAEKNEQATDTAASQAAQKQQKIEVDTLEADLMSALDMAAAAAQPAMWWLTEEQFTQLWGKAARQGIATPGAEIMRRHGLSMGGLMGQYGPYIGLVAALAPSVAATVSVYKQKKQGQIGQEVASDASVKAS